MVSVGEALKSWRNVLKAPGKCDSQQCSHSNIVEIGAARTQLSLVVDGCSV